MLLWTFVAANMDELMEMITAGAEKIINTNDEYEGLNLDDLNNFKLDVTVQQWEGEDFRSGVSVFLMQIL
jgi:SWI/SNF-related matrix-associated actin-dependent regulator of chromatin subfamily A member 5